MPQKDQFKEEFLDHLPGEVYEQLKQFPFPPTEAERSYESFHVTKYQTGNHLCPGV